MATLVNVLEHLDRATDEQISAARRIIAERLVRERANLDCADAHRPSYAPSGRETASQRGAAAVARATARTLDAIEREVVRRRIATNEPIVAKTTAKGAAVEVRYASGLHLTIDGRDEGPATIRPLATPFGQHGELTAILIARTAKVGLTDDETRLLGLAH